jgi:fibronectin type 3 domain-containing protein
MLISGEQLIIIEKDDSGNYYMEKILWKKPSKISIDSSISLKVSETKTLTPEINSLIGSSYNWTSSNNSVASVTSDGQIIAWAKGTAVITVKVDGTNLSAKCTVTVDDNSSLKTSTTANHTLSGSKTDNVSANNYSYWSSPMTSFIYQNSNGSYVRVEYLGSKKLLVETYTSSYTLSSTETITLPYSLWGGYYHGSDGSNYVVVGQPNTSESDSTVVMQVIKYSSSWSKQKAYSAKGANTYIPFEAGNCRMTEYNGLLYVYTCHKMYCDGDDIHHQANMTYVINESDMTLEDSYYDIMNISYGYVSHSFNQFIATDGTNIYRVDHGDGYPRGIAMTSTTIGDEVISPHVYGTIYGINGEIGDNATGVSVGGMELFDKNVIVAANSVTMDDNYSADSIRNILIVVQGKTYDYNKTVWLTSYTSSSNVKVCTPQLVKVDDSHFLVMWEEYSIKTGNYSCTKMACIDSDGTRCSSIVKTNYRLSDCQPIVNNNGQVVWYTSNGSSTILYTIDIYNLSKYSLPATPSVTLSNVAGGVRVSWNTISGADSYYVYRKVSGGSWSKIATISGNSTVTYTDKTAKAGTKYYYTVRAHSGYVLSEYVTNKSITYLARPTVKAANASTGVKVSWSKTTGATGYIVYRKTVSGKWTAIKTITSSSTVSYLDKTAKAGTTYYYTVRAYAGSTTTNRSSFVTDVSIKYLAQPTVTLSNAASGVKVSWSKTTGASGYYVYRKTASGSWSRIKTITSVGTTSYTDTTAKAGTTYYYTVKAYSGKTYSTYVTNKTIKRLTQPAVTLSKVTKGVKVAWKKITGASGYYVYRKASGAKSWTLLKKITSGSTVSYTDTTAKSGTTYYYTVKAYSGSINSSYVTNKSIKYKK